MSNAAALLRSHSRGRRPAADEASGSGGKSQPGLGIPLPAGEIECLVELGRVQLEFSEKCDWPIVQDCHAMEVAERYSNVLNSKDPSNIFKAEEQQPVTESGVSTLLAEGRTTLCEALRSAIVSRHFRAARRALLALLHSYGPDCVDGAFEILVWLQSVTVCLSAQETLVEVMPQDHSDYVHAAVIRLLHKHWPFPSLLQAWKQTMLRVGDSPMFQNMQLSSLPPVVDLITGYVPPLTLIVSMLVHTRHVYVGAACAVQGTMKPMVARIPFDGDLPSHLRRLQELHQAVEKDLITTSVINEELSSQVQEILSCVEQVLAKPIARDLVKHFWPYGVQVEHPSNPRHMVLLPDSTLWSLPFEHFRCFEKLFGSPSISRDFSLHSLACRARTFVEGGAESKPLDVQLPLRSGAISLITDTFDEDALRPGENPKSETMSMLHKRLLASGFGTEQSIYGQMHTASPQDVKVTLADSSAVAVLAYGRFFTTLPSKYFASQDLRQLGLLAVFSRVMNDSSFRRQTKTDSLKSVQHLAAENDYGFPLIAAFRGVSCTVMTSRSVPAPVAMRSFETFLRALQSGKNVGASLNEVRKVRACKRLLVKEVEPVEPDLDTCTAAVTYARQTYLIVGLPWISVEGTRIKKK